ncbi:ABC transporter [Virgibacillus dokdonensis]|uniref:Uncharacterized protein n=1 Tax=Virgibacillus dokdonensis TaxID=302167 RepID=A0A2K9J3K1_9BACI|nr:ABC transporter [Virgibacillus dokdonensis]AUJ26532.1 hypothetical protein A21D_03498 [Virgibacillus dokdonensis]
MENNIEQKLWDAFKDWEEKTELNEWYLSDSYEEITRSLTPKKAYESIPEVISVLLQLKDSFLIGESINYLYGLYGIAQTTEIHPYLEKNLDKINDHINNYGDDFAKDKYNEFKWSIRIKE